MAEFMHICRSTLKNGVTKIQNHTSLLLGCMNLHRQKYKHVSFIRVVWTIKVNKDSSNLPELNWFSLCD